MSGTEAAQKKVGVFHVRSRFRRLPRCPRCVRYRQCNRELTVTVQFALTLLSKEHTMKIHKSAAQFAIAHNINLGRLDNGFYYIGHGSDRMVSIAPTAKSALCLCRRFLGK